MQEPALPAVGGCCDAGRTGWSLWLAAGPSALASAPASLSAPVPAVGEETPGHDAPSNLGSHSRMVHENATLLGQNTTHEFWGVIAFIRLTKRHLNGKQ